VNQRPTFTEGKTFEVVRDHHFIMTEEDVFDGGRNRLGMDVSHVPLNVPLCKSCDGEIVDALCRDCMALHADLLPELRAETKGQWQ
jgi:hypothetical protein